MKKLRLLVIWGILAVVGIAGSPVYAQENDILEALGGQQAVISGLKEALNIGIENAVEVVSQLDGFYKNSVIKILLPEKVRKVETLLRKAGLDALIDEFELSMNRAAEQAASVATGLFVDAIKEMTFDDAVKILKGKQNEATLYFQDKTSDQLLETFEPLVENAMFEVGVTRIYQTLETKIKEVIEE